MCRGLKPTWTDATNQAADAPSGHIGPGGPDAPAIPLGYDSKGFREPKIVLPGQVGGPTSS